MRQGDPLCLYLFTIVLEILAISICKNDNIQGIIVDGTEIKLELFADDLTAFLRNDKFLSVFLEAVKKNGNVTGLIINFGSGELYYGPHKPDCHPATEPYNSDGQDEVTNTNSTTGTIKDQTTTSNNKPGSSKNKANTKKTKMTPQPNSRTPAQTEADEQPRKEKCCCLG